mmetsp:Transcript_108655/g.350774  ORF Transcript_108655/g.350774 Transcript_108655/m.350774 type:complete len:219 (-) Transcript_108655:644-1300(-)
MSCRIATCYCVLQLQSTRCGACSAAPANRATARAGHGIQWPWTEHPAASLHPPPLRGRQGCRRNAHAPEGDAKRLLTAPTLLLQSSRHCRQCRGPLPRCPAWNLRVPVVQLPQPLLGALTERCQGKAGATACAASARSRQTAPYGRTAWTGSPARRRHPAARDPAASATTVGAPAPPPQPSQHPQRQPPSRRRPPRGPRGGGTCRGRRGGSRAPAPRS